MFKNIALLHYSGKMYSTLLLANYCQCYFLVRWQLCQLVPLTCCQEQNPFHSAMLSHVVHSGSAFCTLTLKHWKDYPCKICFIYLLPFPLSRRWFSIQNSQLVYQKKLKASPFIFQPISFPLECRRLSEVKCNDNRWWRFFNVTVLFTEIRRAQRPVCGFQVLCSCLPGSAVWAVDKRRNYNYNFLILCLQDSLTVVVEDLRLCSVKPCEDIERRFCFEVVSPTK